jgi:23S rRNA (guanosine2251-2'-O)-methyltransferase
VSGSFVLYGRNPIREALRARRRVVHRVWATRGAAAEPWLRDVEVLEARAEQLSARAGTDAHQGLCAEADPYPYVDDALLLERADPLIVVLDELQDPQNLGAICRTAECVGADGVVIPQRRSAEVTPAVCKASAGAVEHLAIARVRNVADFLGAAKEAGSWCYGAAAAESAIPYAQPDYRGGCVLVIGAEGRGLRPRVAAACDQLIALPLRGHVQSLNASAAAAALLYGILQRREALDSAP